jgi:hypothetical protein
MEGNMTTRTRILAKSAILITILAAAPIHAAGQATELYWAGSSSGLHKISLADPIGSSQFIASIPVPSYGKMAAYNDKLYWITTGDGKTVRANLDGTGLEQVEPDTLPDDLALALRDWVRDPAGNYITSLANDPATAQRFSPAATVTADTTNGKMYWIGGWNNGGAGLIGRSNLDGSSPELLLDELGFEDYTLDLVLDVAGGKMYWNNPNLGKIQRANLDGTGLEDIATGVDATALALHPIPEPAATALVAGLSALTTLRTRIRRQD